MIYVGMQCCKKCTSHLNSILKFKKGEQKSVRKGKTNKKRNCGVRGVVLVSA